MCVRGPWKGTIFSFFFRRQGTLLFHFGSITGDAENINKQARPVRTNWIKNKQAANGLSFGLEQVCLSHPVCFPCFPFLPASYYFAF